MVEERKATLEQMKRGLGFMFNRGLAKGWICWLGRSTNGARKKAAMSRGLLHMLNRKLSLDGYHGQRWRISAAVR